MRYVDREQSALTDFLAQHNISARQIRLDYEARQRAAQEQLPTDPVAATSPGQEVGQDQLQNSRAGSRRSLGKRSKKFKRRRFGLSPEDTGDDDLAQGHRSPIKQARPMPGQIDNCVECGVRFTVTPYSRAAPEGSHEGGGLLCAKCARNILGRKKSTDQHTVNREKRRQIQSNLLDGQSSRGAKSLLQLCIEKVAKHIDQIDDFGDQPPQVLDKLSRILSKSRAIDSTTIQLFLKPDLDAVSIYDCGKLEVDDYKRIFAIAPAIGSLTLLNASQFQNDVMDYFTQRIKSLRKLHLHSANLIDDNRWQSFFVRHGYSLESLRLEFLDEFFTLDTIKVMVKHCSRLKSLRLEHLNHFKDDAVQELAKFTKLEHLTVRLGADVDPQTLIMLIEAFGWNLRTLAIKDCASLDRSILTAIRTNCPRITRLNLSGAESLPFSAFSILFNGWKNPGLTKLDLSSVRTLDLGEQSDGDAEFTGTHDALTALMAHSGKRLEKLDLHSSRPISHEDLCSAFTEGNTYSYLKNIDLSFVQAVDDFVVGSIVRCCPKLEFLTVSFPTLFQRPTLNSKGWKPN
ncbi:hypothetical protein FGG08_003366 [Glutinoglossum americanum]|uniref:DNA repair protein rhp7 treble clef domain-containing protein n=1 Tax=Glutinoglossum americanum TaxID=1670608 RepID=A0A9P8I9W2_9PEZI|nr:hypothetical protein FGG08_003366 [Glutinoglossum americanum]